MKFLHALRKLKSNRPSHTSRRAASRAPKHSRCLLLGTEGSGKTSFLLRVKRGKFVDVSECELVSESQFNVEELLISKRTNTTLTILDPPGSDRRNTRLFFSSSAPGTRLSILFFLPATAADSTIPTALEELLYTLTYARAHGCEITFLGIVLNKQDLFSPTTTGLNRKGTLFSTPRRTHTGFSLHLHHTHHHHASFEDKRDTRNRAAVVERVKSAVREVMDSYLETFPKGEEIIWRIFDGGGKGQGLSVRTGDGIPEVFEAVVRAGLERKRGLFDGGEDEDGDGDGEEEEDEEFIRQLVESVVPPPPPPPPTTTMMAGSDGGSSNGSLKRSLLGSFKSKDR
ncbi:GTP binding [Rhizina undulata]